MGIVDGVLINFNFDALITIDVFLLMFPYVLIYLTAMILRVKEPDAPRPFRVPLPTWALGVWVAFPIAIAIIALFINGTDWMIGGLAGVLTGPIAYIIFKSIYKGTTDGALEGSTVTPDGRAHRSSAPQWKECSMTCMKTGRIAAIVGILGRPRRDRWRPVRALRAAHLRHPREFFVDQTSTVLSRRRISSSASASSWWSAGCSRFKWPRCGGASSRAPRCMLGLISCTTAVVPSAAATLCDASLRVLLGAPWVLWPGSPASSRGYALYKRRARRTEVPAPDEPAEAAGVRLRHGLTNAEAARRGAAEPS